MNDVNSTWVALLLADPSPCLRRLVLADLLDRPNDPETQELGALISSDRLAARLLATQRPDGGWAPAALDMSSSALRATAQALLRLGYLGFTREHPAVQRAAAYLFAQQRSDGAWPLAPGEDDEGEAEDATDSIPLQTALPLRGLAACGYATDPHAERAYAWLLAQRLPDGAWPTGYAAGSLRRVGGYRRLAHSRWGCRSNTTGALACLALHPGHRRGPEAARALDLLLGRETQESWTLGFEVARIVGAEPVRGTLTYFARYDLAQVLDLCWRIGATIEDDRIARIVSLVTQRQGAYGLWDYAARPQAARWITFDLLRSLSQLEHTGAWLSLEPRTPFRAYTPVKRRY